MNDPDTFRIHEFAELAGVTVKALRHYDRIGLLAPARSDAGYRLYQRADLERLQQIVVLKSLGLPLKRIRSLLERDASPLLATLRLQRAALEDKRRSLDRAIDALTEADAAFASGVQSTTAILQRVIMTMDAADVEVMRQYYSEEAWRQWRNHYEDWPPDEWRALYRDIHAALHTDPAGPVAQVLADRWLAVMNGSSPIPSVRTGLIKAWGDRKRWPQALKRRLAEFDVERATRFIGEALWERWDAERVSGEGASAVAPPRVSERRRDLFHACVAVLDRAPDSAEARAVVRRWSELLDRETAGDEDTRREMLEGFRGRREWPAGMTRYTASLYDMDAETWVNVTDFIERAATAAGVLR